MFLKIKEILKKKDLFNFKIIIILNFLTFFLEFISLSSIPVFVALIIDSTAIIQQFEKYGIFYFSNLEKQNISQFFGLIIISIFLIKNVFYFLLIYIQGKFLKDLKVNLSKKLLKFYVYSPFSYHIQNNPALLTRNSTETIEGVSIFILQTINLFRESLAILVVFTLLVLIDPIIIILITLFFSIVGFFYLKKIKPIIKNKAEMNENFKVDLIQMINESFGAIKDIKILNKEDEIINHYDKNRNKLENNMFYFTYFEKTPKLLLETLAIFMITVSTLVALSFNKDILSLFTALSLIVIAVVRFIPAFNSVITSLTYIRIFTPSLDIISKELKKIENQKIILINEEKYKFTTDKNLNLDKNFILIKNISFSYNENKKAILKNINLEIEKGSKVGITGITGSGKSTLFHVMLGLLLPQSGNIYYKKQSIYENMKSWRSEIGYIAQNIYLLDSTIEKNISFDFVNENIDKERMEFSIKMSNLEEKISELPLGLKTKVGNDGVKLSGGEKQRVALARSIYRNPSIFFMDESTSALDLATEKKIMKNIKENFSNKTIILIAHRKTTIDECDKLINLKDGYIS